MSELKLNAQNFVSTAWAHAKVKQSDDKLFAALSRAAEGRVSELNAQSLANTTWVFATVKQSDQKLFKALAKAA